MLTLGLARSGEGEPPAQTDGKIHIRLLNQRDATAYRDLRLRGLKEAPTAFGSSYEDESRLRLKKFARKLRRRDESADAVFGAFSGPAQLVGILDFNRDNRPKRRHVAVLGGLFVAPEFQGQGYGGRLIDEAIAHARQLNGVRQILLAVTAGNVAAGSLYRSRGFKCYGLEPDAILVEGKHYDMELMMLNLQTVS